MIYGNADRQDFGRGAPRKNRTACRSLTALELMVNGSSSSSRSSSSKDDLSAHCRLAHLKQVIPEGVANMFVYTRMVTWRCWPQHAVQWQQRHLVPQMLVIHNLGAWALVTAG